jgi:UDP-N-acetyl-D-glucosamine dehydrogenase
MSAVKAQLLSRIQDRTATVGIVGLGYVGLPLAMEFAKAGFHVIGYDVSERVCKLLMRGESHIQDVPAKQVARHVKAGRFIATTDEARLADCDTISIAVPTPSARRAIRTCG